MNKQTYFYNQYALYQYHSKVPELHYQDFTLQLTPEGTIHLTTSSKEFDSIAGLFKTINYWKDSHYEYADTLIGIEIANAISEAMFHNGLRFPYFMTRPYYDFINASLKYYNVDVDFHMDCYANKYLKPYLTEHVVSESRINPLEQLGITTAPNLPLVFSKREEDYFMVLRFQENEFFELPIHGSIVNVEYGKVKLRSYYRTLCNLLYHSGHTLTEEGKLHSNKYYTIAEEYKPSLEILLQKVKSHLKEG